MKRENASYLIAGIAIFITMSMTISQAERDNRFKATNGVMLVVPAKPIATMYVTGTVEMYKYIKKGYQVQAVADGGWKTAEYHMFLMVKY